MLHPAIAHFAVSLPIITFILGLAYIYKPSELMSKLSSRFMLVATLFMIAAYFSGKEDGGEAYIFLTSEGQELLKQHKDFALYLVIGMIVATLIKLFGCIKKLFIAEVAAIVLIAILSAGVLYQGSMGGEITYTHGANVKDHSDGIDCLKDPEFYLE
jgi:uncharacterized membrane protein